MNPETTDQISRRSFVRRTTALALAAMGTNQIGEPAEAANAAGLPDAPKVTPAPPVQVAPYLTPAKRFGDVSRGDPRPSSLVGLAQEQARLTAETWRLEITVDSLAEDSVPATLEQSRTLADGTALDLPALMELGRKHEVKLLKAMQCLNIGPPLGQGLWEGVPLREVLRGCGKMNNVRRIYYWGYHNHDPKQIFKSSVSYTQAMETAPDDLPVFLAYRLNGEPIPPERGGPVRMVVPWAHGFKSIKWLDHIFLTNDCRANDTYANGNNDPESALKTAAYLDGGPEKVKAGDPVRLSGRVMTGRSGCERVEYWVRAVEEHSPVLADDDREVLEGSWLPCELQPEPDWTQVLPEGISPHALLGFDKTTGKALSWPLRYSLASFSAVLRGLPPGKHEVRARAVDLNGFAQPEPRPAQKAGKNGLTMRRIEVM